MEASVTHGARSQRHRYTPPTAVETVLAMQVLGPLSELESRHAPASLYLAGDKRLLDKATKRVAIVGSRDASTEGHKRAAKLARGLATAGVVVVSGLAKGIDRAAHEASIDAGGRTIAVIGTPLDVVYPVAHAQLQERLYREHLVVSQFEPGRRTYPSDFVRRNRTMALVCDASVIIEASDTSGTLSQAAETQRLKRPLFMMRSVLSTPGITWPSRFAKKGAIPLDSVDQILAAIS